MIQSELAMCDWVLRNGNPAYVSRLGGRNQNGICMASVVELTEDGNDIEYRIMPSQLKPMPINGKIMAANGFGKLWPKLDILLYVNPFVSEKILFRIVDEQPEEPCWIMELPETNHIVFDVCSVHEMQRILRVIGSQPLADLFEIE